MRAIVPLVALLVIAGPIVALPTDRSADWQSKADAPLLGAVEGHAGLVSVVVQGPAIAPPAAAFATRGEWLAHWSAQSVPFIASLQLQVARLGGLITGEVRAVNAAFVSLDADRVPELLAGDDIRLAGLDWVGATFVVDDPALPFLPGGPGVAVNLDQTIALIEAPQMHAIGYRGEGVKLAVIDTGIRGTHEMMKDAAGASRVAVWFDATGTPGNPTSGWCATACDRNGHGTHTATTAAGSNLFNPGSPQGVAPRAVVIGVRIFQGGGGTWQDAQEGLQGAFDRGAEVTSNSWGGGCNSGGDVTADLANTLSDAGMWSVFAAGNSGPGSGSIICPGAAEKVITVGAIDINENIAGFSSRGPCEWRSGQRICPDVVAVGVNVNAGWNTCDTCYVAISGTSMATPHVAGATALLLQAKEATTGTGFMAWKVIEGLEKLTAKDLGVAGADNDYGWGLVKTKQAYDQMITWHN